MFTENERVTVVACRPEKTTFDWNPKRFLSGELAFVRSLDVLAVTIREPQESGLAIERLIVDRAAAADDFLDFLSLMPGEFEGDVVFLFDDGSGVLSAGGGCGERRLHALCPSDVRFYLEALDLVSSRTSLALSA